ncbi:hypothetical protein PUNSTDRAFT_95155 [Punctularia strigosozonata HHB-11173 SS5]|uniref:uncharacterized protein n=1 Tax=Punctularia strigosozonata (strain HHB-11173) TaxID=741275 RepID=UPI00044185D9|nr:uncharacterized protein PUNSTDRAFT_95155 [Punctularia strigosozonata HHB-11173 SS5]EIN13816.1 hypothetical protein PUNSTDRAFT_95155 [Punctularia strigosozonata HHB-11173 SS5]
MVRRNKKRASGRCKTRSSSASSTAAPSSSTPASSSVAATSSDAATIVNVAPVPSLSSSSFEEASSSPTSSKHSEAPSSTHTSQVAPTTNAKPTTTKQQETTTKASATKTSSAASSTFTQSFLIGTQTGQGTFYATGLGACGITNTDTDYIAAVSHLLFDTFPGYNGVNPNNNPICNKKVTATYKGKSVSVTITDRCTGCALTDLDFSPSAFDQLADESVGRLSGMTWVWDDL